MDHFPWQKPWFPQIFHPHQEEMRAYLTAFELDASQAKAPQKHVGGKWGLLGWPTGHDGDEL